MDNIGKIRGLAFKKFDVASHLDKMRDARIAPQIPCAVIGRLVIEMPLFGQKSILEVDEANRSPEFLEWHGSKRRMVASDTTVQRSLEGFDVAVVHGWLWDMGRKAALNPGMEETLPSGRTVRLGILDGSAWGGFYGSVLVLSGRSGDCVAGYRMSKGHGHELDTSRALLKEAKSELGRGAMTHVLVDGLYMTKADFRRWPEESGCHIVVKTAEESLTVIEDAEGLFSLAGEEAKGVDRASGVDDERGVEWTVSAAWGFDWQGVELNVARVQETAIKPRKGRPAESKYWVFTTDRNLSAADMREIGHLRWRIENGTFKRLSALVDSKRRITKNPNTREALLGLWFVGLNLMAWITKMVERMRGIAGLLHVKLTCHTVRRIVYRFMLAYSARLLKNVKSG